jgi:hypothetical protein
MTLATSKLPGKLWSISMSRYRPENKFADDEGAEIWDVSGCTALFFFSDKGVSAYHIEAGKEKDQVKWATNNALSAGSPNSVVLYAPRYSENDREKESLVVDTIKATTSKFADNQFHQNGYWIDTGNRNQRFRFFTSPPEWIVGSEEYEEPDE